MNPRPSLSSGFPSGIIRFLPFVVVFALLAPLTVLAQEKPAKKLPLPGETFMVQSHPAFLMLPEKCDATKPTPWVWYAPTLPKLPGKEETWMFERFLSAGIGIAGIDVGESMGNPAGRALFSAFHKEMVTKRGMSAKPCLLARSRGGLMLYNWAAENPQSVTAIAGIYPVGDLTSWPGLAKASAGYGLTQEQLAAQLHDHNPIDRLAPLAKAGVPIMHIHGDKDTLVPLDRNSGTIKQRYDQLGGSMTLEVIKGGGHDMNPHWFQNQSLAAFIIRQLTGPFQWDPASKPADRRWGPEIQRFSPDGIPEFEDSSSHLDLQVLYPFTGSHHVIHRSRRLVAKGSGHA